MALVYIRRLFPFILILVFFVGCKEKQIVQDTFDKAEAFMETHSDSAYTLLRTIETEKLRTQGGRARYALLYTQAQDKNYIDDTNDSLISIAVDYYRYHGDVRHRFLSIYYKGRVLYNAGDYLKAMVAYTEAEGLVPDLHDDYYAGLLYSQLGSIYREYCDFPKSLEAYQKAELYYKNAGKDFHRQFAITNQSVVYRNMDNYVKSDSLLQTVLAEAIYEENHTLIDYTMGNLLMQYVEQERMQEAKYIYEKLVNQYGIENKTSSFMVSVAKIHLYENEIQNAEQLLDEAWKRAGTSNDSIDCHLAASQLYKAKGQFVNAIQEQETGVLIQNRMVKDNLQQPVLTMQRDYLAQELEYQSYKRKMNRLFNMVVIVFVVVLALSMGYILQKRLRRHYRESLHNRLKLQEAENKRKIKLLWEEATKREHSIRQRLEELNEEMQQKDEISIESIRYLQEELNKQGKILLQYKEQHDTLLAMNDREIQKQRELGVSLLHSYFKTLDKIFVTYYYTDYYSDSLRHSALNDVLTKYLEEYFKYRDKKGYDRLETMVNVYMNNVMVHFRSEVKFPKEEYYQQICFLFAGFSGKFIAYIMDSTPNTIYKRKVEFIKKIKEHNPQNAEIYLNLLVK